MTARGRAVDRGLVPVPAELVTGTASELNDLLAAGELDVSVVSAVEYARNAAAYHLLPDLAISCDGPVHSVALFSRRPVAELTDHTVLLSASSRTSVLLLQLLLRHQWGVDPRYATVRAEPADLASGLPGVTPALGVSSDLRHDAHLVVTHFTKHEFPAVCFTPPGDEAAPSSPSVARRTLALRVADCS